MNEERFKHPVALLHRTSLKAHEYSVADQMATEVGLDLDRSLDAPLLKLACCNDCFGLFLQVSNTSPTLI